MFASEIQSQCREREKTPPQHQNNPDASIGFELNNHIGFGLPQCALSVKTEGEHYSNHLVGKANHLVGKDICVQGNWSVRPVKS